RFHRAAIDPKRDWVPIPIALDPSADQIERIRPCGLESIEDCQMGFRDRGLHPRPRLQQLRQPAVIPRSVDHFVWIALYRLIEMFGLNAVAAVEELLVREPLVMLAVKAAQHDDLPVAIRCRSHGTG